MLIHANILSCLVKLKDFINSYNGIVGILSPYRGQQLTYTLHSLMKFKYKSLFCLSFDEQNSKLSCCHYLMESRVERVIVIYLFSISSEKYLQQWQLEANYPFNKSMHQWPVQRKKKSLNANQKL